MLGVSKSSVFVFYDEFRQIVGIRWAQAWTPAVDKNVYAPEGWKAYAPKDGKPTLLVGANHKKSGHVSEARQ